MVNFLLISKKITKYTKKQIDKGFTPQKVYELCSSIREAFCLSYSIRKENNLYIYFQKEHLLICFIGNQLRYLGPDERSQALLLLKALNKGFHKEPKVDVEIKKSTPGIYSINFTEESSFTNFLNKKINGNIYLIIDDLVSIEPNLENSILKGEIEISEEEDLYIIPTYTFATQKSIFLNGLKQLKKINYLTLSKIKSIENKILYINFRKDHQENL